MIGTLLTIDIDGQETVRTYDAMPSLEILQHGVGGGDIQLVPLFNTIEHNGVRHDCVVFVDEDGKNKGLSYNVPATKLWQRALLAQGHPGLYDQAQMRDYLVGRILVVWGDQAFMEAL